MIAKAELGAVRQPIQLFYCYASNDEGLWQEMERHLSTLNQQGLVAGWHRGCLLPGDATTVEVRRRFAEADIIIPLVSSDFLSSELPSLTMLAHALARQGEGKARVVPVIVRPCDYQGTPIADCACLPKGAPVTKWDSRDAAWLDVAQGLRRLIESVPPRTAPPLMPPPSLNKPPTVPTPAPPWRSRWLLAAGLLLAVALLLTGWVVVRAILSRLEPRPPGPPALHEEPNIEAVETQCAREETATLGERTSCRKLLSLLEERCYSGQAEACTKAGALLLRSEEPQRGAAAAEKYRRGCDLADRLACHGLGTLYERGPGIPRNEPLAYENYRKACNMGLPESCNNLGLICERRGHSIEAFHLFEQSCGAGYPRGCVNQGRAYADGIGTAKNSTKAVELLSRACSQKEGHGCNTLGLMYENGEINKTADLNAALELQETACKLGDAEGCTRAGWLQESWKRNKIAAAEHYERGCEKGDADGCQYRGVMHSQEKGPESRTRAADYLEKACAYRNWIGCYLIGARFEQGDGRGRDRSKARSFYEQACRLGKDDAVLAKAGASANQARSLLARACRFAQQPQ